MTSSNVTYNRRSSPTQNYETAKKQQGSGQIWGRAGKIGGSFPRVEAFIGKRCTCSPTDDQCPAHEGIEFTTEAAWTERTPYNAVHWLLTPPRPGVIGIDDETIAIEAKVTLINYFETRPRQHEAEIRDAQ